MRKKISKISFLHYIKLVLRSLLFLAVLVTYLLDKTEILTYHAILPMIVWGFFVVEMLLRFFPSKLESMGCQKQFARNYEPIGMDIAPPISPGVGRRSSPPCGLLLTALSARCIMQDCSIGAC